MCFSRPWKSVKTECGLWILWSCAREKLISQKQHFPRLKSCLKKKGKKRCVKSQRMHFLSVLTDRVRRPSATVRVASHLLDVWKCCVPSCCFSVPYCNGLKSLWITTTTKTVRTLLKCGRSWLLQFPYGYAGLCTSWTSWRPSQHGGSTAWLLAWLPRRPTAAW